MGLRESGGQQSLERGNSEVWNTEVWNEESVRSCEVCSVRMSGNERLQGLILGVTGKVWSTGEKGWSPECGG